jgi:hypothetical protein
MGKVNQEMAEHGDMVMLPVSHPAIPEAKPEEWLLVPGGEAGGMAASSTLSF